MRGPTTVIKCPKITPSGGHPCGQTALPGSGSGGKEDGRWQRRGRPHITMTTVQQHDRGRGGCDRTPSLSPTHSDLTLQPQEFYVTFSSETPLSTKPSATPAQLHRTCGPGKCHFGHCLLCSPENHLSLEKGKRTTLTQSRAREEAGGHRGNQAPPSISEPLLLSVCGRPACTP